MATRSITTPTPTPPFEAQSIPTMTLDEAIAAVHPICQMWSGLSSIAAVLHSIKSFQMQADVARADLQGLHDKRQAALDALAKTELEVEEAVSKAVEDGKRRQESAAAQAKAAEDAATTRTNTANHQSRQAEEAANTRTQQAMVREKSSIDTLKSHRVSLETDVASLSSQREEVSKQVASLKSELAALKARLG